MVGILVFFHTIFCFIIFVTESAKMVLLVSVLVHHVPAEVLHVLHDHSTHQTLESFSCFLDWQGAYKSRKSILFKMFIYSQYRNKLLLCFYSYKSLLYDTWYYTELTFRKDSYFRLFSWYHVLLKYGFGKCLCSWELFHKPHIHSLVLHNAWFQYVSCHCAYEENLFHTLSISKLSFHL